MAAYVLLLVTACCSLALVKVPKAHGPAAMLKAKFQSRLLCTFQAQSTIYFMCAYFAASCTDLTVEHV